MRMMRSGQSILLCGYTGLEGTLRILDESEEELKERFVPAFLDQIRELRRELVLPDVILGRRRTETAGYLRCSRSEAAGFWRLCGI